MSTPDLNLHSNLNDVLLFLSDLVESMFQHGRLHPHTPAVTSAQGAHMVLMRETGSENS